MKLLCDTIVILDVALHRKPFYAASSLALSYCEDESVAGLISGTSLTDLFISYIMQFMIMRSLIRHWKLHWRFSHPFLRVPKI